MSELGTRRLVNVNEPKRYEKIADVPTEMLAHNFVGSLILAEGNLNKYQALTEMLIRELRGEPQPTGDHG